MTVPFTRWTQLDPARRAEVAPTIARFLVSRAMTKTGTSPAIIARIAYLRKKVKEFGTIPAAFPGASGDWLGTYPDTEGSVFSPPEGMEWNAALLQCLEEVYLWQKMALKKG